MVNILTTSVTVDGVTIIKDSQGRISLAKKVIEDFGWWSLQTLRIDAGSIDFLPSKIIFSYSSTGGIQYNLVGSSVLKMDTNLSGNIKIYLNNLSFSTSGPSPRVLLGICSSNTDTTAPLILTDIFLDSKSFRLLNNDGTSSNLESTTFTQDIGNITYLRLSWDGSGSSSSNLGFSDGSEVTLTNTLNYPSNNKLYILFGCGTTDEGVDINFDVTKIEINR